MNENENVPNLKKCPRFDSCNCSLCPLDHFLSERHGPVSKCKYMKEAKQYKIADREFIGGGKVMPDSLLNFTPQSNLKWLNESSKKRWQELHNK